MRKAGTRLARCRLLLLIVSLAGGAAGQRLTPSPEVDLDGNELVMRVPGLVLIGGRPLDRLRDGGSVVYTLRLAISGSSGGAPERSREQQFVVSYDIWEETFAVTELGTPPRSVTNLSAEQAQAWCLNSLALPTTGLVEESPVWLRLEYRAELEDATRDPDEDSGLGLGGLINIFSRRQEREVPEGVVETGPFRLSDLR